MPTSGATGRRRWGHAAALAAAAAALPHAALAAEPGARAVRFNIAAQPTASALLELALQADVSLGGALTTCQGEARRLHGRMRLTAALDALVAGSGCRYVLPDRSTVLIEPAPPRSSSPPAPAPEPPSEPPPVVSELVVTSGRRAELAGRAPYAVTAATGDDLQTTSTEDLRELASRVAGMTVTNLGPGRDKVLLRGISDGVFTGLTQSTVGLYLDDVPVTYNAPNPDLRLIDVARVEVMRGPQGTLYGSGSIGGIVRIVTNKPDPDDLAGSVMLGVSGTRSGGLNDEVEIVGNVPVVAGRVALRGVVYRERGSGYLTDVTLGLRHVNRVTRDGARLALGVEVSPEWTVTLAGVHQSINDSDTQYVTRGLGRFQRASRVQEPHDNDFDEVSATVEGRGRWGHVTWSAAGLRHVLDSRYDATAVMPMLAGAPGVGVLDDRRHIEILVSELAYASPKAGRLRWLGGAFASVGEVASTMDLTRRPTPTEVYGEHRTDSIGELAVYGEVTYDLMPRLDVTAGVRWFRFTFDTDSDVVLGPATRLFNGSSSAKGLSPKLAVRYQWRDTATLYAQVTEGYRPGGFNTAGPTGQAFDGALGDPAREFDFDELWNYEAGAKLRLLDGRLAVRLAAFFARWRHIQSDQFLSSGLPYAVNVGDGSDPGLEAEIAWRLSHRLTLTAAGLIAEPELVSRNPAFDSRRDTGLPGVPGGSASMGLRYTHPLWSGLELTLDGNVSYVGSSFLSFSAQLPQRMGDYATGKVSATIASARYEATLFVDNPFDTRADTFAFGNPFRLGRDAVSTPLRPVTVGVQLRGRF
ncbi:TonB-dependent receptor [Phenylobacterium sp.]|uniref:TonB-dependent receptor n=1 Tax=Phenylobacterium sp. TaxID=1871053 RepID=UPI002F3FC666